MLCSHLHIFWKFFQKVTHLITILSQTHLIVEFLSVRLIASLKGHKYTLVVVDYFRKWVKAISLEEVDQNSIILETITTNQGTVFIVKR